uniref:N-acetylgalactosaminide beta-1,3-galactosyltransferase n=1 Tax=Trichobilharzia regenti TaxID=157069 RepID=A0AA85JZ75_TRIRE|nr:unnamed protein product [Trichobilharzia regenti]
MISCEIRKIFPLLLGIVTGIIVISLKSEHDTKITLCSISGIDKRRLNPKIKAVRNIKEENNNSRGEIKQTYLINIEQAKKLHTSVRLLCYINTIPKTHKTKAMHVKNSWAKRCTKYLFMSSKSDDELPTVKLNLSYPESRKHLWSKMRAILRYVYQYRNDYDYFLKADDDTFVVIENLRSVLSRQNPNDPFMMGYNFPYITKNGYFSGGAGYVLSREALKRIVEQAIDKHPNCPKYDEDKEDVKMSMCGQPVGVKLYHMREKESLSFQWRNLESEYLSLVQPEKHSKDSKNTTTTPATYDYLHDPGDLLSDHLISLHYIRPLYMYLLEFMLYHLRPIQQMEYLNLKEHE